MTTPLLRTPHRTSPLAQYRIHALLETKAFWSTPVSVVFIVAMPIAMYLIFGFIYHDQGAMPTQLAGVQLNEATRSFSGMFVFGLFAVGFTNTAIGMAMKRTDGRLRRLRVTAADPLAVIAAALTSWAALAVVVAVVLCALAAIVFGVTFTGLGVLLLALYVVLGMACFMALGFAVSLLFASADTAAPLANMIFFPVVLLSGTFMTVDLGDTGNAIVGLLPVRPLVELVARAMADDPQAPTLGRIVVLLGWTAACTLFSIWRFRWSSEREYRASGKRGFLRHRGYRSSDA